MPIVVSGSHPQAPATDSTSPDGFIRARVLEQYAGVHLTVDYGSLLSDPGYAFPNPFRATVYRTDDQGNTVVVRSADDRQQGGGRYYAYDDEVGFGKVYTYYAEATTDAGVLLRRSFGASVITWAPDGGNDIPGVWIKSLDNPECSIPVRVKDWSQWTFSARNTISDVLNSKYSAINMRERSAGTSQLQVLTRNETEYTNFQSVTQFGVVFIASLNRAWQRDGYYLVNDISPQRATEFSSDFDYWAVSVMAVERPKTANQNSPSAPWGNYADAKRLYPTYTLAKAHYPTYKNQSLDGTL